MSMLHTSKTVPNLSHRALTYSNECVYESNPSCVPSSSLSSLHLLLLLGLPGTVLQKVTPEQPIKQDNIHGRHDGHTHAAQRVGQEGHLVPVEHQPAGHPGQRVDAEHHVCAQVDYAVDPVQRAFGDAGHTQHLPEVEEHRVYLHQQGHHGKAHVAARQHREAETGDHLQRKTRRRKITMDVAYKNNIFNMECAAWLTYHDD